MGFVRILQPVSPQLIKISKKTHYPSKIFSIGHCLIFKHYAINWESFQKTQAIKVSTPLLTVSIGNYKLPFALDLSATEKKIMNNPLTRYVTMNSHHLRRAHSGVFCNKNRELLCKIINEMPLQHNIISINFQSFAAIASPKQIEHHLRQCLQKYLGITDRSVVNTTEKSRGFFSILFPFKLQKWGGFHEVKRRYQTLYGQIEWSLFRIFLCHHYKVHNSLNLDDMRQDMRDLRAMLQKFDFLQVIAKINANNNAEGRSRSRRFIKILKWRTLETEQYLIFLINQFGQELIRQALPLFESVCATYSPPQ